MKKILSWENQLLVNWEFDSKLIVCGLSTYLTNIEFQRLISKLHTMLLWEVSINSILFSVSTQTAVKTSFGSTIMSTTQTKARTSQPTTAQSTIVPTGNY